MKLATLRNGARDGRLVVVSRDLTHYTDASFLVPTLQAALDNWDRIAPHLEALSQSLNLGAVPSERFHEHEAMAPIPRAHLWADGSAYINHVELARRVRGEQLPESLLTDPLMYLGAPDAMLGARDPMVAASDAWGVDMEGEIAVITSDVPMGASPEAAGACIRLVMLANDISFRRLIPAELDKGFGFCQSKGPTAFSPVAVTPDELGEAWNGGRLSLPLQVSLNGRLFGQADAGTDMVFDFGQLIAHAAKTRPLGAGAIIGSGTVSNRGPDGGPGKPVDEGGKGYSCILEQRTVEAIAHGRPATPFLAFGDVVRIEMIDSGRRTIFGAIEQEMTRG